MSLVNATRSELAKQFSTSVWWILAIVLAGYVGMTATGLAFALAYVESGGTGEGMGLPTGGSTPELLYSISTTVGYVFPLLIGTLLVTGEFRHKTLTPTFLATPRRGRVLWAKLGAGAAMGLLYGVVALIVTVGPSAAVLAGYGLETALGSSDTWAMFGRILLAYVLWVFVGIGTGLVVRNQIAAVVIVLAFTQFVEPLLRLGLTLVNELTELSQYLPGAAGDALVGASIFTGAIGGTDGFEWWAGGLVLLAYALVLLLIGYVFSWRRDVD